MELSPVLQPLVSHQMTWMSRIVGMLTVQTLPYTLAYNIRFLSASRISNQSTTGAPLIPAHTEPSYAEHVKCSSTATNSLLSTWVVRSTGGKHAWLERRLPQVHLSRSAVFPESLGTNLDFSRLRRIALISVDIKHAWMHLCFRINALCLLHLRCVISSLFVLTFLSFLIWNYLFGSDTHLRVEVIHCYPPAQTNMQ